MAKAHIVSPDGLKIEIEGTPKEISAVIGDLKKGASSPPVTRVPKKGKGSRVSLIDLIASLIDGGFFKTPRDLATVKTALQELGHHYPVTTLSPTMLRQVRKRELRRLRQDKRWVYTR